MVYKDKESDQTQINISNCTNFKFLNVNIIFETGNSEFHLSKVLQLSYHSTA